MDIIKIAQDLISIRSETGNKTECLRVLEYTRNLFVGKNVKIEIFAPVDIAPVIYMSNTNDNDLDVMILGHLDVVPADDKLFTPYVKDGILYGRGSLDMKSFAAVAFNTMEHVLENNLPIKFGILLSTDEEKGSKGTHAFLEKHPTLMSKIVLDNDVGGDIQKIVTKCKNPVFVKIKTKGLSAHGSTPWDGIDANQIMFETLENIKKVYPYYSKHGLQPENKWIDTMHVAKISGGEVSNIIAENCEALIDFRLTENSTVENLKNILETCMAKGASFEIVSESTPVVMDENNQYILDYKNFAEKILGKKIEFEHIGGATDSRAFAVKGSIIIMHSGTGEGMHGANEWAEVDSILKLADIQIKFLEKLSKHKIS